MNNHRGQKPITNRAVAPAGAADAAANAVSKGVRPYRGQAVNGVNKSLTILENVSMARQTRIEYAGAAYLVMARGNQGRRIYADDADRERWRERGASNCLAWVTHN